MCLPDDYMYLTGIKRDPDIETDSNVDLTDLLGIAGVPTFLFIHQEGTLFRNAT